MLCTIVLVIHKNGTEKAKKNKKIKKGEEENGEKGVNEKKGRKTVTDGKHRTPSLNSN